MIKLITSKQGLFLKLIGYNFFKKILLFDPYRLDKIHSDVLFNKAIQLIRFKNGTFKTTKKDRFKGIDDIIVDLFSKEESKSLNILDIGVSDASTTSSLSDTLSNKRIKHKIVATDLYIKVLVEKHFFYTNFYDEDHEWIFSTSGIFYFSSEVPYWFILSRVGSKIFNKIPLKRVDKEIYLISPSAREKVENGTIEFTRHDVFKPLPSNLGKEFDLIRCMNILNPRYFATSDLQRALFNLKNVLSESGVIQVGKSENLKDVHNVSFFRKESENMVLIKRINNGSEVDSLVS